MFEPAYITTIGLPHNIHFKDSYLMNSIATAFFFLENSLTPYQTHLLPAQLLQGLPSLIRSCS